MRTSWKQRWKATYLKKYIFYKFIKDTFLYIIKWVIQNVFYSIYQMGSICIKNSFPLRGNMVSVLQFLLKKKIQFRCICCVSFTRWGKTNDVRLLFSGIEWTKFASREKWFLSHRHMHWSDCLWVVYSMYLYIFFPSCCQLLLYHIYHQRIKVRNQLSETAWDELKFTH